MIHNGVHAGSNVSVCGLKSVNVTEVRYVKGYELYFPLVVFMLILKSLLVLDILPFGKNLVHSLSPGES